MKINMIIILMIVVLLSSCRTTPIEIIDNYRIYSEDEYGKGYYLMCKLGCDNDTKIERIKFIKWNNQHIIIEQQQSNYSQWYMIKAKGENLMCCNNDSLCGPFTKKEIDTILSMENIKQYLKEISFR